MGCSPLTGNGAAVCNSFAEAGHIALPDDVPARGGLRPRAALAIRDLRRRLPVSREHLIGEAAGQLRQVIEVRRVGADAGSRRA